MCPTYFLHLFTTFCGLGHLLVVISSCLLSTSIRNRRTKIKPVIFKVKCFHFFFPKVTIQVIIYFMRTCVCRLINCQFCFSYHCEHDIILLSDFFYIWKMVASDRFEVPLRVNGRNMIRISVCMFLQTTIIATTL